MASRRHERIDFRQIADAAVRSLETLLAEWLPDGHREGHEYKATNPTRSDRHTGSFSINLNTGAWGDFATDDKGGDPVSLYAYLNGVTQLEGAKAIAERLGIKGIEFPPREGKRTDTLPKSPAGGESDAPAGARDARSEWEPIFPTPAEATELPKAHPRRRFPETQWEYRDRAGELLGAVYRFKKSTGDKEIIPCVWAKHRVSGACEWRWMAFPEPRPLYGLNHLHDEGPVLVVEGEKCADAARSFVAKSWSVVTWPGGSKVGGKADWAPLRGRKVIIWPDCDAQKSKDGRLLPEAKQPGVRAAEEIAALLRAIECEVRIVKIPAPGAKPGGWDVADAIADGWSPAQMREFIVGNLREAGAPKAAQRNGQAAPARDGPEADYVHDEKGNVLSCATNAFLVFTCHEAWRDVIAFDEFAQRPVKRNAPPHGRSQAGEWEAMDDSFAMMWLAQHTPMVRVSSTITAEAAEMAARAAPFDPVCDYLARLAWDGTKRVDRWLTDCLGAPDTPYTRLAGRFWLVGMVKRAFEPGCKFDYMPILEGPQGKGKSTALAILAGDQHFGDTLFVIGDKDSMAMIQGKWIYEIAELDSFNKAESTRVKGFVASPSDEFRPAYGRRVVKMPRRVVLVGTTNQYEYFKDTSGNRRYWPIKVLESIKLEALRQQRDQLMAEAVVLYRARARCYPTPEEQDEFFTPEQDARQLDDAWDEAIRRYLDKPGEMAEPLQVVSNFEVLRFGLHIDAGKITREMSTRVGISMRKLEWNKRERRGQHPRYVYERPKKSANDTGQPQADQGEDVPF